MYDSVVERLAGKDRTLSRNEQLFFVILASTATLCAGSACRRDPDAGNADTSSDGVAPKPAELLVFPQALRVEEPSVNDFVERAMTVCAAGDYEKFRLLWSVREEPLTRDEYQQGWQAVQEIRIRALAKAMLSPDPRNGDKQAETAYVILAEVDLDPALRAGRREPTREVVLMMIREHGAWRLAGAPEAMRKWLNEQLSRPTTAPRTP